MALKDHDIRIAQHAEYDGDGLPGVQCDAYGDAGAGPPIELHASYGSLSIPLDPDADGTGCMMHTYYEGSRMHCIASHDPRVLVKLPTLKKGESISYGPSGQFTRYHDDGSITHFTTEDGTEAGRSVYARIMPTGFMWVAPWGKLTFDATGFHMLHESGARIDLGGLHGLPAPLDALTSYAIIQAATVSVKGSAVASGAGDGHDALALSTPTLAFLNALMGYCDAITTALGTVGPSSTVVGLPAVVTAAASAHTAAAAAVAALKATTSST